MVRWAEREGGRVGGWRGREKGRKESRALECGIHINESTCMHVYTCTCTCTCSSVAFRLTKMVLKLRTCPRQMVMYRNMSK